MVTQPDRPSGRGRKLEPSPVKRFAVEHGLAVLQPETLRAPEAVAELAALRPDVIVVAAFGQILRPAVLALPPHGCVNVHASLLPRWRGAAPVQAAILAGDQVTGNTIMLMDEGMDTGPVLSQSALAIHPDETAGTLTERLSHHGAELLADTLPRWLAGETRAAAAGKRPGDSLPASAQGAGCDRLVTGLRSRSARAVRAYNPWPGAVTAWNGVPIKVLQATALAAEISDDPPGTVWRASGSDRRRYR